MRLRALVAVGTGVAGALLAHALDEAALLPGVHEAANVRAGMGMPVTGMWLGLAAALSWLAANYGAVRVGAPASLLVAAVPELVGRHDPGAVVEPGAIAAAMLQWLLLVAVVVAVVVASRSALTALTPLYGAISWPASVGPRLLARSRVVDRRGRPRAPPEVPLSAHFV
jgi:hypothetical protein